MIYGSHLDVCDELCFVDGHVVGVFGDLVGGYDVGTLDAGFRLGILPSQEVLQIQVHFGNGNHVDVWNKRKL